MKKKRILSILIITCMLTSSLACTPSSAIETSTTTTTTSYTDETTGNTVYVTSDGFEYIITENSEVCITKYTGNEVNLVIPEQIEGLPVTIIGNGKNNLYGNLNNYTIEEIHLPETISQINHYAFFHFEALKEIYLNKGLTEIGHQSLDYCYSLERLIVPSTVNNISAGLLAGCYSIKELTIYNPLLNLYYFYPNENTIVKGYQNTELYEYCSKNNINFESLGIYTPDDFSLKYKLNEDGTITITGCSFYNITEINIPEKIDGYTVTAISNMPAKFLEKVTMPDTVTYIEPLTFYQCQKLKSVKLSKNITAMPTYESGKVYEDHTGAYLYTIYRGAFENCYSLEKIIIPNTMTSIEYSTFSGCGLEKIVLPSSITHIDDDYKNMDISYVGIKKYSNHNLTIYTYPNANYVIAFAERREFPYKFVGDVTEDNAITSDDALSLLQHTVELSSLSEEHTEMCDFDLDSKITSSDALRILQYTVGLNDSLY